jgi:UDP-N-acetylglucosamine--N-acetylmuramyl-(pentapeptide) pyrophosphoryl-undecaprenol N-acetylglucosamine transferase
VLLLFGGSQGARHLNETVPAAVGRLAPSERSRFQVLHFTGQPNQDALAALWRAHGVRHALKQAEGDMHLAYLAAGLVICRAGAATLFELALFGRPAVLVPLPTAADDHQTANARVAARHAGALLLPQADATPAALASVLEDWLRAPDRFRAMGERLRPLAVPDAAERVAARLVAALDFPGPGNRFGPR